MPGIGQVSYGVDATPWLTSWYTNIYDFFKNYDYTVILFNVKIFAGVISAFALVTLVVLLLKMKDQIKEEVIEIKNELNPPEKAMTLYDNRWDEIRAHVNSMTEADWKLAVIEADKFVDDALKKAGFEGESMGERLMMIKPGDIINLQNLWDAHKLRNLLVHDSNYQITHRQAILAVEAFDGVLRELGALSG